MDVVYYQPMPEEEEMLQRLPETEPPFHPDDIKDTKEALSLDLNPFFDYILETYLNRLGGEEAVEEYDLASNTWRPGSSRSLALPPYYLSDGRTSITSSLEFYPQPQEVLYGPTNIYKLELTFYKGNGRDRRVLQRIVPSAYSMLDTPTNQWGTGMDLSIARPSRGEIFSLQHVCYTFSLNGTESIYLPRDPSAFEAIGADLIVPFFANANSVLSYLPYPKQ